MNHEDHEDHEAKFGSRRFRLPSPLSDEAEDIIHRVIGCAIEVHRRSGPGLLESIYKKAMCLEMDVQNIAYVCEQPITVVYRGHAIEGQRLDLMVEQQIVVELKAVGRLDEVHEAQLISYLRTTGLRAGLLINFRVPVLVQGLRRIVL